MDSILISIGVVYEYLSNSERFHNIEGWMNDIEGYSLMKLASFGGGTGEIVEIGSFHGKSTCWIAAGSKSQGREKVTAIDLFEDGNGDFLHSFMKTIESMQVSDYITPLKGRSDEIVRQWHRPIRLLFIDGDHSYEGVKMDYDLWSPFVSLHGFVAFHDIGQAFPGAVQFYNEVSRLPIYRQYLSVNALRVLIKVG